MPVWEKMLCCSQHQVPRCGMDSRGTIHLEMLKTWRLLTSAIRVMSCSLSSCSPAACCSTVVPLSDLCVRQMCIFATWGTEVPPDSTGRGKHSSCALQRTPFQTSERNQTHLSWYGRGGTGRSCSELLHVQQLSLTPWISAPLVSSEDTSHHSLILLDMKNKTCSYGEGQSWGILCLQIDPAA